jgi:hypothetical protein
MLIPYFHRYLEGARWDSQKGLLRDSFLKELHPVLPVMHLTAVEVEGLDMTGKYECPIFYTATRGGTFTFAAQLKTGTQTRIALSLLIIIHVDLQLTSMPISDEPNSKWVLAGVALLLSVEN